MANNKHSEKYGRKLKQLGIDTSHFRRVAPNKESRVHGG
jgi:hypothetical protein